jgi:hypothetical protein
VTGDLVPREQLDLLAAERDREEERTALALIDELRRHGVLDDVSLRPSELPVGLTAAQALALGGLLGRFHRSIGWYIGDLVVFCKRRWGEAVAGQIEAVTGLHPETLADYERTAEAIPPGQRVPGLSFRHHRAVKTLEPGAQRSWLARSVNAGWSSDRLRVEIAAERAQTDRTTERAQPQPPVEPLDDLVRLVLNVSLPSPDGRICVDDDLVARLRAALGETA